MRLFARFGTLCLFSSLLLAQAPPAPFASGLPGAQRLILSPEGNLLVSEASPEPNRGRVSFVARSGVRRSLIEGLPSGSEVTLAGGSGPSGLALRGRTLYIAVGTGDAERVGPRPGTSIHNPEGVSSRLFATILECQFNRDIDALAGTFQVSPAAQVAIAEGNAVSLEDGAGGTLRLSLLARFPLSEPDAQTIYRFANPFGLALSDDGATLWVADASTNSLNAVATNTGRWRRVARLGPVPNPTPNGPPVADAVPTSVRIYGSQFLVSLLTGFPFAPGNSRVLAVNPDGSSELFLAELNSAIDVLYRPRANEAAEFYVLEFSANPLANAPGRLLRYVAGSGREEVIAPLLITPVSMVIDERTNEIYILELRGNVLRLPLGGR